MLTVFWQDAEAVRPSHLVLLRLSVKTSLLTRMIQVFENVANVNVDGSNHILRTYYAV